MINGTQCHVLQVDDPSKVNAEMGMGAERTTYYVHADRLTPGRVVVTSDPSAQSSPQLSSVTVDLESYTTTDGLTLPHRMEIHLDANISAEQCQKMNRMTKSLESPSEQKRKQMENMMGGQMEMMKQIMAGEPITIAVQSVMVDTNIPEGGLSDFPL